MSTSSSPGFALRWWLRQRSDEVTRPRALAPHDGVPIVTLVRHRSDGELPGQNNTSTKRRGSRRVQGYEELNCYQLYGLTSPIYQCNSALGQR